MMFTRRSMLIGATSSAALSLARAGGREFPNYEEVPEGNYPGDYGYLHAKYHTDYQLVFGAMLKCACGYGDCRVTYWRKTRLGSTVGYDVVVNRQWWPLPHDVSIPTEEQIPKSLFQELAHVCAYGGERLPLYIPCAIINRKDA